MRKADIASAPIPELPPARYVAEGYYTSAYFTLGPEKGHPLVLCHGLAANGLQFVTDAHFFAEQGFKVIVPDLRGHGRSRTPDIDMRKDKDFSIARMADDLVGILDAERAEKTHWVGNSLGGILGLSIMGSHPDRLTRFVSFGTSYSMNLPPFTVGLMRFATKLIRRNHLAILGARLTCRDNIEAQAIIFNMLRDMDRDCILRIAGHIRQYDLIANAWNFQGPMLMLRGSRDTDVNRAMKDTLSRMREHSNFFVTEVEKAGHCLNLDRPEFIQGEILKFIGSRTGATPGSPNP